MEFRTIPREIRDRESEMTKLRGDLTVLERAHSRLFAERENLGNTSEIQTQIQDTIRAITNIKSDITKLTNELAALQRQHNLSQN